MFILCLKSSHAMGMGHVFRMVHLHQELHRNGRRALVVILGSYAPAEQWLKRTGVPHVVVSDDDTGIDGWEAELIEQFEAQVWINDRMDTGEEHATRIKGLGVKLVTFDDLGSGAPYADVNVSALAGIRGETPQAAEVLVGLPYLILDPAIARYRRQRKKLNSWVVSLGGTDTYGTTLVAAQWLRKRRQEGTLVLGPGFDHRALPGKEVLEGFVTKRSVPSLAKEFSRHDFAITGGGITAFEAAAAGLPTLTVASEKWEVPHCLYLEKSGCSRFAGEHKDVDLEVFADGLDVVAMSGAGMHAVDLNGVGRVCKKILELLN